MGKNWNSKTGEWTDVVRDETQEMARIAKELKNQGLNAKEIAVKLDRSVGRIYELLRH